MTDPEEKTEEQKNAEWCEKYEKHCREYLRDRLGILAKCVGEAPITGRAGDQERILSLLVSMEIGGVMQELHWLTHTIRILVSPENRREFVRVLVKEIKKAEKDEDRESWEKEDE
jgi:hypothetical protein